MAEFKRAYSVSRPFSPAPMGKAYSVSRPDAPPATGADLGDTILMSEEARKQRHADLIKEKHKIGQIKALLGGDFNPEGGLNRNIDDLNLRWDFSRSDEFSEKNKKFKKVYPKGTLTKVPLSELIHDGEEILVFKRNQSDLFQFVDPKGSKGMELLGDVAQITGSVVSEGVAGATYASKFAKNMAGRSLLVGSGFILGDMLQWGIESLRGYEDTPAPTAAMRSAVKGGAVALIDMSFGALGALMRAFGAKSPGAIFQQKPSTTAVIEAAERQRLSPPMAGQTARHPVVRGAFQQAAGTSPIVQEVVAAQRASMELSLSRKVAARGFSGLSDKELEQILDKHNRRLNSIMKSPSVETSKGGRFGLDAGKRDFIKSSREWKDRRYADALEAAEDVTFTLIGPASRGRGRDKIFSPVATAARISKGIPFPGRKTGEIIQIGKEPTGELKSIIDTIKKLAPVLETQKVSRRNITAYEAIKTLRSRAFNLYNSSDGTDAEAARSLWLSLSRAMDNPTGGNPEFKRLYQAATIGNSWREKQLRKTVLKLAVDEKSMTKLAEDLGRPGNFEDLQILKRVIPESRFMLFQDSFRTNLMANPETMLKRLDGFSNDMRSLDLLVSRPMQNQLRRYAFEANKWEAGPIKRMLNNDMTNAERALELVSSKVTAGQLRTLISKSHGGKNSKLAISIKAGIYQRILNKATTLDPATNIEVLSPKIIVAEIANLKKSGKLDAVFTKHDWEVIGDFNLYASVTSESMEVGGAMQKGENIAGAFAITRPWKMLKSFHTMAQNAIVARTLAVPMSSNILLQSPGKQVTTSRLRNFLTAVSSSLQQEDHLGAGF